MVTYVVHALRGSAPVLPVPSRGVNGGVDLEQRQRRREEARRRTRRQRRIAVASIPVLVGAALAGVLLLGGSGDDGPDAHSAREQRPAELPRGGRSIFPERRVVAFYGAPQARELGALGIGGPAQAARRLEREARRYEQPGRPVLPAFELIATIVQSDPGEDRDHSARQTDRTIGRYLRAARRHDLLLILDIQPGYAPFMREVRALRRYLEEPDVSLALDPEWSMSPPVLPGQEIGSTSAAVVNEVSAYLSRIVRERRLPEKLLVVHRFTRDMLEDEDALRRYPGVALTVNVDGFGDRPNKRAKYREFTRGRRDRHHGFKVFYAEDTDLMRPRHVLRLRPPPELVVYE
jgi:hypothetical protein